MQIHARRTTVFLSLLLLVGASVAIAWTPAAPQDPAARGAAEEEDHEYLENAMGDMGEAMSTIHRAVEAGDAARALSGVAAFQRGVLDAKLESPPSAAKKDGEERTKFVTSFRSLLVDVLRASCDLEDALLKNDMKEARKLIDKTLERLADKGHDTFGG